MRTFTYLSLGLLPVLTEARNPIRKVVNLLQQMQTEIQTELDKEAENYKKFTCYCDKNGSDLSAEVKQAAMDIKMAEENSKRESARAEQLGEEIKTAKKELKEQRQRLKDAQNQRDEERNKYNEATKEIRGTLESLTNAVAALEKGMGIKPTAQEFLAVSESNSVSALQSKSKGLIRNLLQSNALANTNFPAQQQLLNFLNTKSSKDYSGQSGEIVGILKQIKDNIDEDLGGAISIEQNAVSAFKKLKVSLGSSIGALEEQVENKQVLKSQAAVKAVNEKGIAERKRNELGEANATAVALKETCEENVGDFGKRVEDGNNELKAIAAAIKVLNNDDSLEKFKAAKDQTRASFLQLSNAGKKYMNVVDQLKSVVSNVSNSNPKMALLALSAKNKLASQLNSKSGAVDFTSVLKMIDEMVDIMKQEQVSDAKSRDECISTLHQNEMDKKALENSISGKTAASDDYASQIEVLKSNIKRDGDLVEESKKDLEQAKTVRQEENEEYLNATQLNSEAIELIAKAMDKLNSYYNQEAVRRSDFNMGESNADAAARVLSDDYNSGNQDWNKAPVQEELIQAEPLRRTAIKDLPETWEGGANRANKSQAANSVLALMNKLSNDLKQDNVARETAEKTAQKDYEDLVNKTNLKMVQLGNSVSEGEQNLSAAESSKLDTDTELEAKNNELANLTKSDADTQSECNFILNNFDIREEARTTEIEGLAKAKAVLSGASFAEPEAEE